MCSYNGISDCDHIEVGETFVIPGTCSVESADTSNGGLVKVAAGIGGVALVVVGIVAGVWGRGASLTGAGALKLAKKDAKKAFDFKPGEMI